MKNAVVLLSGGLDSTTTAAIAQTEGFSVCGLSFDYGQRHHIELKAATRAAKALKLSGHTIARIDLRIFGGSALTSAIPVPKNRSLADIPTEIPVTYVPARNTIFLSFALAYAEVLKSTDIFIGVNALDYSGYPDCRPDYIAAYEKMANLAIKLGVEGTEPIRIHTPLINLNKAQIIAKGIGLGIDYSITLSCYDPDSNGAACGGCDSCLLRKKGFEESKVKDPTIYQ